MPLGQMVSQQIKPVYYDCLDKDIGLSIETRLDSQIYRHIIALLNSKHTRKEYQITKFAISIVHFTKRQQAFWNIVSFFPRLVFQLQLLWGRGHLLWIAYSILNTSSGSIPDILKISIVNCLHYMQTNLFLFSILSFSNPVFSFEFPK